MSNKICYPYQNRSEPRKTAGDIRFCYKESWDTRSYVYIIDIVQRLNLTWSWFNLSNQHNDTVRASVNSWRYEFYGSLRLNLTQHGKTHQVNGSKFKVTSGPGIAALPSLIVNRQLRVSIQQIIVGLVQHQLAQGTPTSSWGGQSSMSRTFLFGRRNACEAVGRTNMFYLRYMLIP
jgi:hypothetical protein